MAVQLRRIHWVNTENGAGTKDGTRAGPIMADKCAGQNAPAPYKTRKQFLHVVSGA